MNILVLVKQVPDTEAKITVGNNTVSEDGIKWIVSPYDEIALEEAIRFKEKAGAKVTALSIGPKRVESALRTAFAMGADRAIFVQNDKYEMLDSFAIAEAIIKTISSEKFDLILCGRQATDSDNGQVPLLVATKLGYPIATFTNKVEIDGGKAKLTCEVEGGEAIMEANLPLVVTANDRLNEPRYPSLKGIMASKKMAIETKMLSDLGISATSKIEVLGFEPPASRPAGRVLDGDDGAAKAKALVDALHNEIKII